MPSALAGSELVLLHANKNRLSLMINLIAQLNSWGVDHIMVLGFNREICEHLRANGRIGCVTSSHLQDGPLAAAASARKLEKKFIAWLQRFHLLKRLLELERAPALNVLALDTDMAIRAHPDEALHRSLGQFSFVTTFDFKGGFANTNIGYIYMNRNSSDGSGLRRLFTEFERRIALAMPLPPNLPAAERRTHTTRFLWDQNLWNKVLLSEMARHAAYLPDGSDAAWSKSHRPLLRARLYWKRGR